MIKPNFFIIGAQKCGTTAMSEYLRHHPHIFMTHPKEPDFFAEDFGDYRPIRTLNKYLALYRHCTHDHHAAGEASPIYICSKVAIKNIYKFNPQAKLIAMLRNPIDLVYSLHQQNMYSFHENQKDFRKAWYLQEQRAKGKHIPASCGSPLLLQYFSIGCLGAQMQRVYEIFTPQQVHIIFFEDFVHETANVYGDLLGFLNVVNDGRYNFPQINEGKSRRFPLLWAFFNRTPRWVRKASDHFLQNMGLQTAKSRMKASLSKAIKREILPLDFYNELVEIFNDDVLLLSKLTGYNLETWIEKKS